MSRVSIVNAGLVLGIVSLHILFWLFMCRLIASQKLEGVTAGLGLLGFWFLFTIIVPVGAKSAVEGGIAVPNGGDILLTARDRERRLGSAKSATMEPFLVVHPEWTDYAEVNRP